MPIELYPPFSIAFDIEDRERPFFIPGKRFLLVVKTRDPDRNLIMTYDDEVTPRRHAREICNGETDILKDCTVYRITLYDLDSFE